MSISAKVVLFTLLPCCLLAQAVHMAAGPAVVDPSGVAWTANTCTGTVPVPIGGKYANPIYNNLATAATNKTQIVCAFSAQPGLYNVLVHMMEPALQAKVQMRIFDLLINDQSMLTSIDVFQRAGGAHAGWDAPPIVTWSTGTITVAFNSIRATAVFAGIELIPIGGGGGLILLDTNGGPPQTITSLVLGPEFQPILPSGGLLQLNLNSATLLYRAAAQSGFRSDALSAGANGNPQTCAEQPLASDVDKPPLVPGQDYQAACSTFLIRMDKNQVLNLAVDTVNIGPVSLQIEQYDPLPLLDRHRQPLTAGQLIHGNYRIWNDVDAWIASEL